MNHETNPTSQGSCQPGHSSSNALKERQKRLQKHGFAIGAASRRSPRTLLRQLRGNVQRSNTDNFDVRNRHARSQSCAPFMGNKENKRVPPTKLRSTDTQSFSNLSKSATPGDVPVKSPVQTSEAEGVKRRTQDLSVVQLQVRADEGKSASQDSEQIDICRNRPDNMGDLTWNRQLLKRSEPDSKKNRSEYRKPPQHLDSVNPAATLMAQQVMQYTSTQKRLEAYSSIGIISALVGGFAFSGFTAVGVEDFSGGESHTVVVVGFTLCFGVAIVCNLYTVIVLTLMHYYATLHIGLSGDDGNVTIFLAHRHVQKLRHIGIYAFFISIPFFLGGLIFTAFIKFPLTGAIATAVLLVPVICVKLWVIFLIARAHAEISLIGLASAEECAGKSRRLGWFSGAAATVVARN